MRINSLFTALALGVSACAAPELEPRPLGRFVLDVSPGGGAARFVAQPVYAELPFAQDGSEMTNPEGTIQAVTTRADLPGVNGCPATANCFRVVVRNFTGARQHGIFMAFEAVSPPTGRALLASDPVPPGITAPGGGRLFGDLDDRERSSSKPLTLSVPDTSPYHLVGSFWGDTLPRVPSVTRSYAGPTVEIDAAESVDVGAVAFAASEFPPNARVDDVNVLVRFHKTAGSCARPGSGPAFHSETSLRLRAPSGTTVELARAGGAPTWSGPRDTRAVSVRFDQAAAQPPHDPPMHPVEGVFKPHGGDLDDFNGESPSGEWVLEAGDNGPGDVLCVEAYEVTIHAS